MTGSERLSPTCASGGRPRPTIRRSSRSSTTGGAAGGSTAAAAPLVPALHRHLMARRDGRRPAGGLPRRLHQPGRPDDAYIHMIGTDPNRRRRGLGRELYRRFFDDVGGRGVARVRAITWPGNRISVGFHAALGFQAGRRPGQPEPVRDARRSPTTTPPATIGSSSSGRSSRRSGHGSDPAAVPRGVLIGDRRSPSSPASRCSSGAVPAAGSGEPRRRRLLRRPDRRPSGSRTSRSRTCGGPARRRGLPHLRGVGRRRDVSDRRRLGGTHLPGLRPRLRGLHGHAASADGSTSATCSSSRPPIDGRAGDRRVTCFINSLDGSPLSRSFRAAP